MPKTIKSKRNQLSADEQKAYTTNLQNAKSLRDKLVKEFPDMKYRRVYTEAQGGGVCRTKLYGVSNVSLFDIAGFVLGMSKQGFNFGMNLKRKAGHQDIIIKTGLKTPEM